MHEPGYNPNAPVMELDQATEDELFECLVQRVKDLFGSANREWIAQDLRARGPEALERAIDICERMPSPPRGYGYVRGIFEKWDREAMEFGPKKTRSERFPAPSASSPLPAVNTSPVDPEELAAAIEAIRNAADPMTRRLNVAIVRGWIATGRVERSDVPDDILTDPKPVRPTGRKKEPAAGPTCQVTPRPAGGQLHDAASSDYTVNTVTRTEVHAAECGQGAPRASNPRPAPRRAPNLRTLSTISFPLPLSDSAEPDPVPNPDQSRPLRC